MSENLFTPTFGKIPLCLAGRDAIIDQLMNAYQTNSGPELSSILVGPRGMGKTALLSYISRNVLEYGWVTANVTCSKGMLKDIIIQLKEATSEYLESADKKRLKGISIGQIFSVEWENEFEKKEQNWRSIMTSILAQLNALDIGVLITIDEVNTKESEMIQFSKDYQHFVREDRKVALLMAGLPFQVSQLLKDPEATFTRRSQCKKMNSIPDGAATLAFKKTIRSSNREIEEDALNLAVKESAGFPYMIQLIGYRTLQQNPDNTLITMDDVKAGIEEAKLNIEDSIYRTTLSELSDGDIQYLQVMLEDEKESSAKDIAERLNKPLGYTSQYRKRLMEAGVITSKRRGTVEFDLPGFKEFLKEEL